MGRSFLASTVFHVVLLALFAVGLQLSVRAPVQEAIYRILAKVLRVRSHSRAAQIEPLVPLLRRLMACRPGLDFPRFYLGRCHYIENRFKEARRMLLALQGPLAFDPRVLNMLGRSAEKLGFLDEAAGCYGRSLETDGRQGTIHFRLARLLARQYEQAVFG